MHGVPAEETFSRHSCLVKHKQNNVIITSLVGTAGRRQETGGHDKQHYYIKSHIYRVLSVSYRSLSIGKWSSGGILILIAPLLDCKYVVVGPFLCDDHVSTIKPMTALTFDSSEHITALEATDSLSYALDLFPLISESDH